MGTGICGFASFQGYCESEMICAHQTDANP